MAGDLIGTPFVLRTEKSVEFYKGAPFEKNEEIQLPYTSPSHVLYGNSGKIFVVATRTSVNVHDTATGKLLKALEIENVMHMKFSPLDSFLLTGERWSKKRSLEKRGNVIIWDVATGTKLLAFLQTNVEENWPAVQWSSDEKVAGRIFSTEVRFFENGDFTKIKARLPIPGVAAFAFSPKPTPTNHVVIFVPEKKGNQGFAKIFPYNDFTTESSSRSFWKAQSAELSWNATGTAVLVVTKTESDKSGKSYYGDSVVYFLSASGASQYQLSLAKKGPVHQCVWSPTGKKFVVVYGYMPALVSVFNEKCVKKADLYPDGAPRNTVMFSPCGQILCVGGFGSLPGHIDFWHAKLRKLGATRAQWSAYFKWSPDSRHFLTAVLSPAMNVDNGIKILDYYGKVVFQKSFDKLYDAKWQPVVEGATPPPYITLPKKPVEEKKQEFFVPRGLTAAVNTSTRQSGPKKYEEHQMRKREYPVGYVPNKRRRKKGKGGGKNNGQGKQPPSMTPEQIAKKLKALKKKLRQIDTLKKKQLAGETLDPSQLTKVASDETIRKEIAALSAKQQPAPAKTDG
eukprot:TRINITY_DN1262_c0_g1_i5.p1 TRINITY_DN1262_c0_g1~~TRINITY_DN1262_c0_g1_i5.p1  ORF type:complete len:567 (-),score=90.73 TRINITY_DN1262_c0_g1_i5:1092-2792(-)